MKWINLIKLHLVFISLTLSALYLIGCNESKNKKEYTQSHEDYQEVKTTRVKFNFDQLFEIKEIKKGQSISDIQVKGIGFQNSAHTLKFEDVNPLESFFIADIDADGFEELYILTRSVGSGSYGKIIGITSNKGKGYKEIYIPEYDNSLKMTFDYLEGYMGHDFIYLKNNQLYREFPVFKSTDNNANPTGGICKIIYNLIEYNNSFSLQVKSFTKNEGVK